MTDFFWVDREQIHQSCVTCGSNIEPRGYVNLLAEITVHIPNYEAPGRIDLILCAKCLEQAARLVGSASQQDTLDLANRVIEAEKKAEIARNDAEYWQARAELLLDSRNLGDSDHNSDNSPTRGIALAASTQGTSAGNAKSVRPGAKKTERKGKSTSRPDSRFKGL